MLNMYIFHIKIFIFILIVYALLYSNSSIFSSCAQGDKEQNALTILTYEETSKSGHQKKKVRWKDEVVEKNKLKTDLLENTVEPNLTLQELQELLVGNKFKRYCSLNELKEILLCNTKIIESKLKELEKRLEGNNGIVESKTKEVIEVLLGNYFNSEDILKQLKKLLAGKQNVELMLKKLRKILLGDNKTRKLKYKLLGNILIGNNAKLIEPEINEFRLKLMNVLNDYSKLKGNHMQAIDVTFLNENDEICKNNLLQNNNTINASNKTGSNKLAERKIYTINIYMRDIEKDNFIHQTIEKGP
ncbi:Plasmodium exported protein, unknown function [Plasmodium ovale]|uniref:Uncharacterized protein n=1 Tax=Plasmodium ovale TaxID=36330 RepID=A0A1D3U933_PLAOA|nr:Plasmodium exported protein, unknown function [Plasmodium ovale]